MAFTEQSLVYLSKEYRIRPSYGAVGDSASAGGSQLTNNYDGPIINSTVGDGFLFEEVFTADGISATFQTTKNGGLLPSNYDYIFISRNGQYVGNEFISDLQPQQGQFTLGFIPDSGEEITLNFFSNLDLSQQIYQEIFTASGSSATFTVTKNGGLLPSNIDNIFVFRNGLMLNNNYLTNLDSNSGSIDLTFTPFSGERIAIVWFYEINNIKPYKQSFTASGSTDTFTITNNNGILSEFKDAILVMRNGQLIDNDYISSFDIMGGTVTLSFTPSANEKIEIIWFVIV